MYVLQVALDNLTTVALLTINSCPFPFPHKISGVLNVLLYLIVISYFVLFSDVREGNYPGMLLYLIVISYFVLFSDVREGNYPGMLVNLEIFITGTKSSKKHRNPRLYTVHMNYFFSWFFIFIMGEKRGNVTNCGNGS